MRGVDLLKVKNFHSHVGFLIFSKWNFIKFCHDCCFIRHWCWHCHWCCHHLLDFSWNSDSLSELDFWWLRNLLACDIFTLRAISKRCYTCIVRLKSVTVLDSLRGGRKNIQLGQKFLEVDSLFILGLLDHDIKGGFFPHQFWRDNGWRPTWVICGLVQLFVLFASLCQIFWLKSAEDWEATVLLGHAREMSSHNGALVNL